MKKRMLFIVLLLIFLLAACQSHPTPSVNFLTTAPSPSVLPTAAISDLPSASPSSSGFIPDTDIPDINWAQNSKAPNSDCNLYEDSKSIYFNDGPGNSYQTNLYCINKADCSVKEVAINCICLTLLNDIVYYIRLNEKDNQSNLMTYDSLTGDITLVKQIKYSIDSILSYNNTLYITYETGNNEEGNVNLDTINPDGSGIKKILDDVNSFSIYKDIIYSTDNSLPDGSPFYQCKLDGSDYKQIYEWIDGHFEINNSRMFYNNGSNVIQDIGSNAIKKMPGYYNFVVAGQFLFYLTADQENSYLYAYDLNTEKTFKLMELEKGLYCYDIKTGTNNVYITWGENDYSINIDRLDIIDGKTSLEQIAVIP